MKIITWNCNMAFRKKAPFILKYKPDLLIVPECEHPDKLLFPDRLKKPTDTLWFGKNKNKGLAIFSYSDYRFEVIENHNQDLQLIIPILVTGGQFKFNMFAIWAHNPTDPEGQYVEQIWKALHHYSTLLTNNQTILIGDFNSNTIWDRKYRVSNHSNVVKYLEEKGIFSTYHHFHQQKQGEEKHPTLYMYRHKDKPYHIDYCFASAAMIENLHSVEVGKYKRWALHSDHVPVMVTFHSWKEESRSDPSTLVVL
ncbi:MAG: endonuclease/exonuclease/phosphatase family protein [Saprospiraceae bacterium]